MKDLTNNPRVTDVECTRDKGRGINLSYKIDGKPYEVQGEFEIDGEGVLHHYAAVTKVVYFVSVHDKTSNDPVRCHGCYGNDYSWLTEPLNGEEMGDYFNTIEEAEDAAEAMREMATASNANWAVINADNAVIEEEEIEIRVQYFDNENEKIHVTSIKRFACNIECYTDNTSHGIRIDLDGSKGEFTASEWEEDLRERGFDEESINMIINQLDMIGWLQYC